MSFLHAGYMLGGAKKGVTEGQLAAKAAIEKLKEYVADNEESYKEQIISHIPLLANGNRSRSAKARNSAVLKVARLIYNGKLPPVFLTDKIPTKKAKAKKTYVKKPSLYPDTKDLRSRLTKKHLKDKHPTVDAVNNALQTITEALTLAGLGFGGRIHHDMSDMQHMNMRHMREDGGEGLMLGGYSLGGY